MKMKKTILVLMLIGVMISATGCNNNKKKSVNIACFPNITHSQALFGMDDSFKNALGDEYQINWFTFNAGPSEMEAIRSGNIDIGYIGPIPAITGYKNVKIIAGVTSAGSVLVSAHNSGIKTVNDLKGKTVAVPQFGNTQDILLRMILENAGIDISENGSSDDAVEIIQQENANIKSLLIGNQIDAALVPEPWGSRLIVEANADVVLDYNEILDGNYPVAVLIVNTEYLEKNRETVKNFLREHIAITDKINKDSKTAAEAVNQKILSITGVALEKNVLDAAYGRLGFTYTIDEESIKSFIDVCIKSNLVGSDANAETLIDTTLLKEIIAENNK